MLPLGRHRERTIELGEVVVEEVVDQVGRESHEVRGEHQRDDCATDPQRRRPLQHRSDSEDITSGPVYRFTPLM